MGLSKYNIYFKTKSGMKIVSTKSGAIVNVNESELLSKLFLIKNDCEVEYDNSITLLKKLGIVVEDCEVETCDDPDSYTLSVTLFTTRQCNFRCRYCYEKFSNEKMTRDAYDYVINFIKNKIIRGDYKNIRINLFGGEPLIVYEDIIWFLEKLNFEMKDKDINISVGLTSNGYLLTLEKYIKLLEFGLSDVQITVDGFQETHDKARMSINGESTWETIIDNLFQISKYPNHSKVILRTNFNSEVVETEKQFLLFCKEHFNNQFIMHFEAVKQFDDNYEGECLQSNEEQKVVLDLMKFCKQHDINNIYQNILARGFYSCPQSGQNSFVFDTKLNYLKCTVLLDFDKNYVGKLNPNGILRTNENLNKWDIKDDKCKNCNLYPICLGRKCLGGKLRGNRDFCDYNNIYNQIKEIIEAIY